MIKVIGKGSCGEVWQAEWNGTTVAVKKIFRALLSNDAAKEFRAEAKILRHDTFAHSSALLTFQQLTETPQRRSVLGVRFHWG